MSRSPSSSSLLNMLLVHPLAVKYNLVYTVVLLYKCAGVSCEMGNCGAHFCKARVKGEAVSWYLPRPPQLLHLPVCIPHLHEYFSPSIFVWSFYAGSGRHGRL